MLADESLLALGKIIESQTKLEIIIFNFEL